MKKRISIKVTPKSSKNKVIPDIMPDEKGNEFFKVFITAQPENNRANRALIKLLAEYFDVSQSKINIVSGLTSKSKIIDIDL